MKMPELKEEHRLIAAFAVSVLIILLFGRFAPRQSAPVPAPGPAAGRPAETAPRAPAPAAGGPALEEPAVGSYAPVASGREIRIGNGTTTIGVDPAGGWISSVGLAEHRRPGEELFRPLPDVCALLAYPARETGWAALPFEAEESPEGLSLAGSPGGGAAVVKTVRFAGGPHTVSGVIAIRNGGAEPLVLDDFRILCARVPTAVRSRHDEPAEVIAPGADGRTVSRTSAARVGTAASAVETRWVAVKEGYGLAFLKVGRPGNLLAVREGTEAVAGVVYPRLEIPPGGVETIPYSLYAGPSDYFIARREIAEPVFGNGIFASMGRLIFQALAAVHRVLPNWGLAIILLTLIVKAVFFPLTRTSLRSMKKMQELRPYLKDIQTKYKDNPQQMQKELMGLYKQYGINPFSGCVPMLVQIPIFIGFFLALKNAVVLRGAPFALWIRDLSVPDSLATVQGFSINILPVLMTVTSFWQQKMTPQQDPSQKQMMYIMPVMFLFLFYNFSAGLLLYWVTMNVASLAEQIIATRRR